MSCPRLLQERGGVIVVDGSGLVAPALLVATFLVGLCVVVTLVAIIGVAGRESDREEEKEPW